MLVKYDNIVQLFNIFNFNKSFTVLNFYLLRRTLFKKMSHGKAIERYNIFADTHTQITKHTTNL